MSALAYEYFVRSAFGKVERGGDPACLAEANIFNSSYDRLEFNRLKIGAGYAMSIFRSEYIEENKLSESEYERLNDFINRIVEASSSAEVAKVIEEFQDFKENIKS